MPVYFIQCEDYGPIKIGKSIDPNARMLTIQASCPYELIMLAHVDSWGLEEEASLHKMFRKDRIRGEWFSATDQLLNTINQVKGGDLGKITKTYLGFREEKENRPKYAMALHLKGYSLREIGQALSVSHELVRRDIEWIGKPPKSDRSLPVEGTTAEQVLIGIKEDFKGE